MLAEVIEAGNVVAEPELLPVAVVVALFQPEPPYEE